MSFAINKCEFSAGDIEKIGKCLNNSWEQKKIIAPGGFMLIYA